MQSVVSEVCSREEHVGAVFPRFDVLGPAYYAKLYEALAKAQSEFQPVKMNAEIKMGEGKPTRKYANLEAMIAATRPALTKYGLGVIQKLHPAEPGWACVETVLAHTSGATISMLMAAPVASNMTGIQALGSGVTYLRRYQYSAMLCLAADHDDDGEAAGDQPRRPMPRQNTAQKPAAATESAPSASAGDGQRKALFGRLKSLQLDYAKDKDLVLSLASKLTGIKVTSLAEGKCELPPNSMKTFVDWIVNATDDEVDAVIRQVTAPKSNVVYPDGGEVEDPFAEMKGSAPSGANPGHGH